MSDMPYACSAGVPCTRCGRSGHPHWVYTCRWNPQFGVCLVCRFPERYQQAPRRTTRAEAIAARRGKTGG